MVYLEGVLSNCINVGVLTDVDWNGMFRTFFENLRVKIACGDPAKIPFERLIEMKKKLFLLGFTVE